MRYLNSRIQSCYCAPIIWVFAPPCDDGWAWRTMGRTARAYAVSAYGFDCQTAIIYTQLHNLAAHPREFCYEGPALPKNQRAQGMPGARCTRSLARN